MFRSPKPFEDDHFGRDDLRTVALHASDRGVLVFRTTRSDRVAHHIGFPGRIEEPKHCLLDTDVSFAPDNDDMPVGRNMLEKAVFPASVEELLVD